MDRIKILLLMMVTLIVATSSSVLGLTSINSCSELLGRPSGDNYTLQDNIDCSGYIVNGSMNISIDTNNYFDGNNFTISNLNGTNYPIFGDIGGELKNIWINNSKFVCSAWDKGIVGNILSGNLTNVHVINSHIYASNLGSSNPNVKCSALIGTLQNKGSFYRVSVEDSLVEGMEGGTIFTTNEVSETGYMRESWSNSTYNSSAVSTTVIVGSGGMLSQINSEFEVSDSYFIGTLHVGSATINYGCFVGRATNGVFTNNYASCKMKGGWVGQSSIGGFIGANGGTFINSYCDNNTAERLNCDGTGYVTIQEKTLAELTQESTFVNWDFNDTWSIEENVSTPYFQWSNPIPPIVYTCSVTPFWDYVEADDENKTLLNSTTLEYENGNWGFKFGLDNLTFEGINIIHITLTNSSDDIKYYGNMTSIFTAWVNASEEFKYEENNPYTLNLSMIYNLGNCYASTEIEFQINDSIQPNCIGWDSFGVHEVNLPYTHSFNTTCVDEDLVFIDINCTNGYNFNNTFEGNETIYYNEDMLIENSTTCFLEVNDRFNNFYSDSFIASIIPTATGDDTIIILSNPNATTTKFEVGTCPSNTPSVFMFLVLTIIALFFFVLGLQFPIFGIFGSILLMAQSWYIIGCSTIFGWVVGLTALLLIIFYAVKE